MKKNSLCLDILMLLGLLIVASVSAQQTEAEEQNTQNEVFSDILPDSYLQDFNGDGQIRILAFGDSLTRGVGDFAEAHQDITIATSPSSEAGYPLRVEGYLGVSVDNGGVPGERLTDEGLPRLASTIRGYAPDVVIISGGSNDAIIRVRPSVYFRSVQAMVNISQALGARVLLLTTPPSCCERAGLKLFTDSYDSEMRLLAGINSVALVDIEQAYENSCNGNAECFLLNLPEGLHPNIEGYDVMGEMVAGSLLGIDMLSSAGQQLFAEALALDPTSLKTVPNPEPTE